MRLREDLFKNSRNFVVYLDVGWERFRRVKIRMWEREGRITGVKRGGGVGCWWKW